jgi:cell division septum initiation protein DivIVA
MIANTQELIVRGAHAVAFTDEAKRLVSVALEKSALIGRVSNKDENAVAFEAQKSLVEVKGQIEKAAQELIDKANEFKKHVWKQRDELLTEVTPDLARVSALLGDFAALEQAKQQAAERLRNEELAALDRQRAEALAQVKSHDAMDAVNEHFDNKARDVAPPPVAVRTEGQRVTNDWDIQVMDIHALYRFHPNCVKLEPLLSEIKNILKAGGTVKGVTAKPIVKAGVRASRQKEVIEV